MRRETISAIRFGYGLGPDGAQIALPERLLQNARVTATTAPRIPLAQRAAIVADRRMARKDKNDAAKKTSQRRLLQIASDDIRHHLAEAVTDPGFGARLVAFWSDHFTVSAKGPLLRMLVPDFIDTAIRPHIAGQFGDMLRAATLHPAMLVYLNQVQSVGPNSRAGKRRDRGLNENLAREIIELHTLGVSGGYGQADVRAFAELLTGLSVDKAGFKFRSGVSEPGPLSVLGNRYGGKSVKLAHIIEALEDIAHHPDTAKHIASKLVIHFIGGSDPDLIKRVAKVFQASEGDLSATYATLLEDDRAWQPPLQKAKLPFHFMASALKAVGVRKSDITDMKRSDFRNGVVGALQLMGQPLFAPPGPDGWSEAPETWITPPGLAARIRWAVALAERIEATHDPRTFLETTLADAATPLLSRAVAGSESRVEGLALTLISPEFNRR